MDTIALTLAAAHSAPTTQKAAPLPQQYRRRISALGKHIYEVMSPSPIVAPAFPLTECHDMIQDIVLKALKSSRGVIGLKASVGTGKTYYAIQGMKSQLGNRRKRVLYLAQSKKLRDEVADHFRDSVTGELLPRVGIAYSRSPNPDDPGYCAKFNIAKALGKQRHRVHKFLCPNCEHHDVCPYRRHHNALRKKQVVLACHEAFFHGDGDELSKFHAVFVDENAMDALVENVVITRKDLEQWERRGRHDGFSTAARQVLSVLKRALIAGPADGLDIKSSVPLLSVLRTLDSGIADHILELCRELQPNPLDVTNYGLSPMEHAWLHELYAGKEPPLVAVWDLISTLQRESMAGTPADSACWLVPGNDGIGHIRMRLPRAGVIGQLKRRVTIFLDGTFPERTMRMLFGNAMEVYRIQAEEFTFTTLFTDSLRKPEQMDSGTWERDAIERFLVLACGRHERPLVVTEKAVFNSLRIPAHAKKTYFRAGDSAGSNEYANCDAVILIGHSRAPGDEAVHLAAALRRERSLSGGGCVQANLTSDLCAHAKVDCPIYGYSMSDGYILVRETMYPVDEDAREIAISSYAEGIIQAIGRARPANPDRQYNPLPVYMLCGEPPAGIRIDESTTLPAWLKANDPEWVTSNPAPSGKTGGKSPAAGNEKVRAYLQRVSNGAMERCEAARISLLAKGKAISQRAVRAEVKDLFGKEPSSRTVQKYFRTIAG